MEQTPRLAVTTVLLHERQGLTEVLLVRRPSTMAVFSDMWVFPGGQVDPADGSAAAQRVLAAGGAAHAGVPFLAPHPSCPEPPLLPLYTAACREIFEEVGVLLATTEAGTTLAAQTAALLGHRPAILADGARFYEQLAALGLQLEIARLAPWSRWITPPARHRRFDTIFFVAAVTDQQLAPEAREIAEACWLPVEDAIREGRAGTRLLMAPTILTLMQIVAAQRHLGSLHAVLAAPPARLLTPVRPRGLERDGADWILFPWDDESGEPGTYAWRTSGSGEPVPGRLRSKF